MLCSTVIPTINRPSLERAVKSALEQDLGPDLHEVIVVNDCGTPLPDYPWLKSPLIKIVTTNRSERSAACNVGAAIATGKYIKILHDDDYLLPGALFALIQAAEAYDAAWTYGALNRVDNEDRFISLNQPKDWGNLFALLVAGESFHPSASLINREIFWRVGGFDPLLKVREDYDLQCRIANVGNIGFTERVVAHVRIGIEGSSTRWEQVSREHRIVREKALNLPGARRKLNEGVSRDIFLRGRICRAYLASATYNLKNRQVFVVFGRLTSIILLAGLNIFTPKFWRGIFYKDYWHAVERYEEELYFDDMIRQS